MTTIAYKDGIMACDSLGVLGEMTMTTVVIEKIKYTAGGLMGICGSGLDTPFTDEWLGAIRTPDDLGPALAILSSFGAEYFLLFVFADDPTMVYKSEIRNSDFGDKGVIAGSFGAEIQPGQGFAIGTGTEAALAAMHCGKSAEDAIKVASLFDANTDDRVQTFVLE